MADDTLTHKIIGYAYKVHRALGTGFLEKIYENALRIELEKAGICVRQLQPIKVCYDGQVIGDYFADLCVGEDLIIEIKAVQALVKEHEAQLVNYLTATGVDNGLLINFGPSVQVKRKFREYKPKGIAFECNTADELTCSVHLVNPVSPVNMVFDWRWLYGPHFCSMNITQDVRDPGLPICRAYGAG